MIDLAPRIPLSHAYPADLDMMRDDDRIVGETLANAVEGDVLLTNDTGVMATARHEGLAFLRTPDAWLPPPEPDAKDKQIAQLQQRLAILESARPVLDLSIHSAGSADLVIQRVRYEPLSIAMIEELCQNLLVRFPAKTDFSLDADSDFNASKLWPSVAVGMPSIVEWQQPSLQAIAIYQARHIDWRNAVRDHLRRLHSLMSGKYETITVTWSLANTGTVPAEGLIVEVEALGNLRLAETSDLLLLRKPSEGFPDAPLPPAWKAAPRSSMALNPFQAMLDAKVQSKRKLIHTEFMRVIPPSPITSAPRSPQVFHRCGRSSRVLSRRLEYECMDFRHGGKPGVFKASVIVSSKSADGSGAISFRASARNLPSALEEIARVRIKTDVVSATDTANAARLLVSKAIQATDQDR